MCFYYSLVHVTGIQRPDPINENWLTCMHEIIMGRHGHIGRDRLTASRLCWTTKRTVVWLLIKDTERPLLKLDCNKFQFHTTEKWWVFCLCHESLTNKNLGNNPPAALNTTCHSTTRSENSKRRNLQNLTHYFLETFKLSAMFITSNDWCSCGDVMTF